MQTHPVSCSGSATLYKQLLPSLIAVIGQWFLFSMSKNDTLENAVYEEVIAKPAVEGFAMGENTCYEQINPVRLRYHSLPVPAKESCNRKTILALFFVLIAFFFCAICACVVFSLEISNLKSETAALQMASSFQQPQNELANKVENLTQQISDTYNMVYKQWSLSQSTLNSSINLNHQQFSQDYSALNNRTQQLNMATQLLFDALERPAWSVFIPSNTLLRCSPPLFSLRLLLGQGVQCLFRASVL